MLMVPARGVGDVELHQVRVEVRCPLGVHVQVHAAWGVADANPRLDPELVAGLAQESQVHAVGHLPFDERPPDAAAVESRIDQNRCVAFPAADQLHRGLAVAGEERPAVGTTGVRCVRGVEAVENCAARASRRGEQQR
jgi:hypothetical protein